jgi:diacylglycerol kinase family enzyme
MARVALLSNPRSTGNQSLLPDVRSFCAAHEDIFHYEVEHAEQIGLALQRIALVKPKVLVINGGDGTVQAALTAIHNERYFGDDPPPVAVLPNGKTNLIAHDLGAEGDPMATLKRVLEIARCDLDRHIVERELIALSGGTSGGRPVLGMFLGGAGLADTMLYCRHNLYPLGLPNGVAHVLALLLGLLGVIVGSRGRFLPPRTGPLKISVLKQGEMQGQFAFLMVTTLQKLLFGGTMPGAEKRVGSMQLLLIERSPRALFSALYAAIRGKLGMHRLRGVHLQRGDEIRIEGEQSGVILDGEIFEARADRPLILTPTAPISFLRLAT